MCGICGVLGTRDSFAAGEEVVSRMRETLVHRGPDDGGTWTAPRIGLGHRRLSIIDLSPAGHQPMSNEDGTVWVTFGGEIYNHEELRPELEAKGHVYRSHTDTETIVHLYEEEGPRCVERLHGMFHYAIWDTRTRELHLARDRLGKKPLYYAQPADGFLFASEIKALLEHPALTPELDEERRVARLFGTDHHELVVTSRDLEEFVPQLVYHQDEPIADWTAVPMHYVSKLARESGTYVVQVGEGSDELFHGYPSYWAHARFHARYRRAPRRPPPPGGPPPPRPAPPP